MLIPSCIDISLFLSHNQTSQSLSSSQDHYPGHDGYPPMNGGPGLEEPFTTLEVRLMRQVSGFGFRIIGGKEEGSQVT